MASSATVADVKALAVELTSAGDPKIQLFLDVAGQIVKEREFDSSSYPKAHASMAAHLLTLANRGALAGGAAGPITAVKVGEVSVNYGQNNVESEGLELTPYGVIYKMLRSAWVVNPVLSNPC